MEEITFEERPGLFTRFSKFFAKDEEEMLETTPLAPSEPTKMRATARYTVTIRRGITNFDDAMAAAQGLKHGEQQILNLNGADIPMRNKIVDFMSGVNYAHEGTWEEIGENIYLICPSYAYVEVASASPRMQALRN